MMRYFFGKIFPRLALMGAVLWFLDLSARADERVEPAWLAVNVGDGVPFGADVSGIAAVEYRFANKFLGLHPKILLARSTTAANYLQLGALYNWDIARPLRLTFSSGPGIYQRNHASRDLNYWLQFYTAVEITVQLPSRQRIGLSFGHISNAGLREPNPGAEMIGLTYSIPLYRH